MERDSNGASFLMLSQLTIFIRLSWILDPPWVLSQSLERHKRTLVAAADELEQRLQTARKREDVIRKMVNNRTSKRQVTLVLFV